MAHDLDCSTGKVAMAYVGVAPWHGLGERLKPKATIEEWIKAAGLDWHILRQPVCYQFQEQMKFVNGRDVLIRSDNGESLSIVSDSYCIVQPKEVLEFYRDLIAGSAFTLETAGALDEGRKVWGLARSNLTSNIISTEDKIDAFLLLASSCDKSLATTVAFTSVRVVCQNTLGFAMDEIKEKTSSVKCLKIAHNRQVDWNAAKKKLNLIEDAWETFHKKVDEMATVEVDETTVNQFMEKLFLGGKDGEHLPNKAIVEIQNLKSAFVNAPGQQMKTAKNTAWGLVNAVTYYADHQRKSNNQSERLDSAWFGTGALLKDKAWNTAMEMFSKAV
jgi:phage/plasmid-like protein (TIGR03299 family)